MCPQNFSYSITLLSARLEPVFTVTQCLPGSADAARRSEA